MCCRCSCCCCCCCRRRLCRLRPSARNLRAPPLRSHLVGDLPVICRSSRGDAFQGFEPCALSAFLAVSLCRLVRVVRGSSVYTVKSGGGCGFCVRSFSSVVPLPRSLFGFGGAGTFSRGLNPPPPPLRVHYRQCSSVVAGLRSPSPVWSACRWLLREGFCFLSVVSPRLLSSVSGTRGVYHTIIIVISVRNPSSDHGNCHQCPEPEF